MSVYYTEVNRRGILVPFVPTRPDASSEVTTKCGPEPGSLARLSTSPTTASTAVTRRIGAPLSSEPDQVIAGARHIKARNKLGAHGNPSAE
jgi:hypothetical protein